MTSFRGSSPTVGLSQSSCTLSSYFAPPALQFKEWVSGILIALTKSSANPKVDEAVVNGGQLWYKYQFGIGGEDPRSTWLTGLLNSAPYLCCAFIGCWLYAFHPIPSPQVANSGQNDAFQQSLWKKGYHFLDLRLFSSGLLLARFCQHLVAHVHCKILPWPWYWP